MRIDVFLEQIFAAVLLPARVAHPSLALRIMHAFVDPEQSEIIENPVAHLALEIPIFGGDVLVQMRRQLVALVEILPAHVADVQSHVVRVLDVGDDRLRFTGD